MTSADQSSSATPRFDRSEIEAAFRHYWELGAVGEDWDAWVDECFTDDVHYVEHILGDKHGREAVRAWIGPTMEEYGEIYTAYEWHQVGDDGRVVVYMQNRRDHPDPAQPPIDFAGVTILDYAGDGRFSREEDFWSLPEGLATAKAYAAALEAVDPGHRAARTRWAWGSGPDWTVGATDWAGSLGAARRSEA